MTRMDYVSIAGAMARAPIKTGDTPQAVRALIAQEIADVMIRDNAKFNRDKFLKACGVGG